ncbi:hypothetical protein B0H12DRAFT_1120854 [Mycena haematopus]|nr:hypothetical protein B0H12DRAFT_1120854 [Mycena haematopus]
MNYINSISQTVLALCLSDIFFKQRDSVELNGLSGLPHNFFRSRHRFISVCRGELDPVDILAPPSLVCLFSPPPAML